MLGLHIQAERRREAQCLLREELPIESAYEPERDLVDTAALALVGLAFEGDSTPSLDVDATDNLVA